MITRLLFSRRYSDTCQAFSTSDSHVASTIKRELGWEVFEYTFNTIIGLKRAISRADKALLRTYGNHVLVVHYKDPKIFNGLIQQAIGGSHYLFYDEKTHRGGLAYAKRGGKGSRSLNKRYEFETHNVVELLAGTIGFGVSDRYYEVFYPDTSERVTAERLDGSRWGVLVLDKIETEDAGEVKACRAFPYGRRKEVTYALTGKNSLAIHVGNPAFFDCALRTATIRSSTPMDRYCVTPIIGTEFVLAEKKLRYGYDDGVIIYVGRKHLPKGVLKKKIEKALEY
ncbi:MAG: hypothetical protein Q4A33_00425 [Candidatus Saccharibacteria bacterium]|nr:hypothetical protein [Candidatus Saccharibacteria bacterium]